MSLFHHDHHKSKTDGWATPQAFVEPLSDAVGGFDLDPASGAEAEPHAEETYTAAENGLASEWFGTVWLNPPFSEKTDWLEKAYREYHDGNVELALILLPVDTSTQWFHDYVTEADLLWFKEGRLKFRGGGGRNRNPNFGVMIAVYGDAPDDLRDTLAHRGVVVESRGIHTLTEQTELPS